MNTKVVKIFKGANWLLFASWYTRIAGMLSFFILARYLGKSDFGIIAGCFAAQAFFSVLSNVGTSHYLIRKENIEKGDLDNAWTINIITRTLIALSIFSLSSYIAEFMKIPELSDVLKVMSLSPIFIGLTNPALSLKVKNLDYKNISYLQAVTKTITATTTICITIIYQTYWAVVISEVLYQMIYSLGSYYIARYKPRFTLQKIHKQWVFSKWILLKGIASYVKNMVDKIVVSRNYTVEDLGTYNFSKESSSTAFGIIITPVSSIIYPSLSEYVSNKSLLVEKLYIFVFMLSVIYVPIIFGGVYLSELIVPLVFGSQWEDTTFLFSIFLIMTFARCFIEVFSKVFILIDKVKIQFVYELIMSVIVVIVVILSSSLPLDYFSVVRVLISYFVLLSMGLLLSTMLPMSIITLMQLLTLPIVTSIVMLICIHVIKINLIGVSEMSMLLVLVLAGITSYTTIVVLMLSFMKERNSHYSYIYNSVLIKLYHFALRKVHFR
ncbi:oligosaccharide flippase family protein [Vibrio alfacsensis]|uniref:oligosaccharide flippase family protein n=1 Tax=Vibrio alfacsensis TaxID=1074311 RepID=UPI00406929F4